MRLLIDLQACQTDSRDRGIGRYTMSLLQAIASVLEVTDELVVAIDMADASRARELRNELHRREIRVKVVAYGYPATKHTDASPAARKLSGKLRARFYASLEPDVLLICSLFETLTHYTTELDWTVLESIPTAVIGYDLIPLLFPDKYLADGLFITRWYRARLNDLRRFNLILSISEATKGDLITHMGISENRISVIGAGFDETLKDPYEEWTVQQRLHDLGLEKPFVLMIGNGDWRKNTMGALRAFADLPEVLRRSHDLVLTQAGHDVRLALEESYIHLRDSVHVLGRVDDATLALLYRECRVFYFPSYYEGFGLPVLEAMAFNTPVLCSRAGALPEVVHDPRVLFDPESHEQGVALLTRVLSDLRFREDICEGMRERALGFTWEKAARKALDALQELAMSKRGKTKPALAFHDNTDVRLMASACIEAGDGAEKALENGLRAIARAGVRRVLVDITEIMRLDAKTGIQRVTRNFLVGLASVARETGKFEVEPFYWSEAGIRYARRHARGQLGISCSGDDEIVTVQPSDVAFMLDSSWWAPERFDDFHARVHEAGGEVVWMVHDLIPIRFPSTCGPGMENAFRVWLNHAVQTADGFVCNSEATRHDLESFIDGVIDVAAQQRPWTRSVHLGCDLDLTVAPSVSDQTLSVRRTIGTRPYFVALGTVEPRKDYKTIIDAFELLWAHGLDVALIMVGKQGWNVEPLVERINHHPEIGRRFFWLQGANDADVRHVLKGSVALIQASISEGFGLPLIEADNLGVPLLVSDIPVFREIAGKCARYFPVGDAKALERTAADMVARPEKARKCSIQSRGWREASRELADALAL